MCEARKITNWLNVNLWFANIYFFLFVLQVSQRHWAKGKPGTICGCILFAYIVACVNKRRKIVLVVRVFNGGNAVQFSAVKIGTFHGNTRTIRCCYCIALPFAFKLFNIWTVQHTFYQLRFIFIYPFSNSVCWYRVTFYCIYTNMYASVMLFEHPKS